jgi:hypothetical protein
MVSYKIDSEVKGFQEVVGEIMIVDDEPMVLSLVSEMIGVSVVRWKPKIIM